MAVLIFARAGFVRVVRPVSDYYVAGRLMPALFNGMALAASYMAVLVFVALAGGLARGWDSLPDLLIGGGLGLVGSALLLAPYLRQFGGYTLPDFLAERFGGDKIRPLGVLAVVLCSFPALAAVLVGLGMLGASIFSLPVGAGVGAGVAMIFLCVLLGGMRSLSLSQLAQYALLFATGLAAFMIVLWQTGSLPDVEALLFDETIPSLDLMSFELGDAANRFALIFCLAAGTASFPFLLMRSFTTTSVGEARTSFLGAPVFAGLLLLALPAFPALYEAAWTVSGSGLSMIAEGILTVSALAGLLATGSALALATANALSHDVYFKSVQPMASARQRLLVARLAVILVTGLAGVAAVASPEETLIGAAAALSLAASAFLPVLVLGVWWKRASSDAAVAGMIAGLVVCLYYMIAPQVIPITFYESSSFLSHATDSQIAAYDALRHDYYLADAATRDAVLAEWQQAVRPIANWGGVRWAFAGLFAVPIGFLVTICVSLFTRAPSEDVQRFVKDLRQSTA